MKKILIICLGMYASLGLFSQGIQVIEDNPPNPRLNVNLELLNVDMGIKNIDGMSFNVGTFGFFEPVDGLGAQWNIKKSLFTFGKNKNYGVPANLEINGGGYFMAGGKTVKKKTKIVLNKEYKGSEYSRNVHGDWVETRTEEVTSVMIPANRFIQKGFRAGYYMKRGPFSRDDIGFEEVGTIIDGISLTSMGVYGGVTARYITNVFINTQDHGVQFNSIGNDFYFDVMFVPVNIFRNTAEEGKPVISDAVKSVHGKNPMGFRVGWSRYQVAPKAQTGKTFGISGSFEAGYKPYQGIFFNGSLGLTLIRK